MIGCTCTPAALRGGVPYTDATCPVGKAVGNHEPGSFVDDYGALHGPADEVPPRPSPADDPAIQHAMEATHTLIAARAKRDAAQAVRDEAQKRLDEAEDALQRAEETAREVLDLPWNEDR